MGFSIQSKKSGKTYYLHSREQTLRNGHKQTLYFFAGKQGPGTLDKLPAGYVVVESERTGLPILKKKS